MKKITAVFLAALALMVGIGIMQAAELKFWGRAGGDEIISIRSARPFIKCSDVSAKTTKWLVDGSGNMQLDGNLTVGGTITNDFNANTTLTTLRVKTTTMLSGATTISGAVDAKSTVTAGGAILGLSTVRAAGAVTLGSTTTASGAVTFGNGGTMAGNWGGSFRWVRSAVAATADATFSVANIQTGWLSFAATNTGVVATLPTAATATCAGLTIMVSNSSADTNVLVAPLGEGGQGAAADGIVLPANGRAILYCDGTNFWVIGSKGTLIYN